MIIPKSFILNFPKPIMIDPIESLDELKSKFRYDDRIRIEDSGKITILHTKYGEHGFVVGPTGEEKAVISYNAYKELAINKFRVEVSLYRGEGYAVNMTPIHPTDPSIAMVGTSFYIDEEGLMLLIESPNEWFGKIDNGYVNNGCIFDQRLSLLIERITYFNSDYGYRQDDEIF